MSRARNEAGFSLVEALVALAVFAMAGVALVQLQSHSLSAFSRVETRGLADLAAQNRITEILSARSLPAIGARDEEITYAGRRWRVNVTVVEAPGAEVRRVSVAVGAPGAAPDAVAHAFIGAPASPPASAAGP